MADLQVDSKKNDSPTGDIRWVCLSDLHFGAENSILSTVPSDSTTVEPNAVSPVLEQLIECLRVVTNTNRGISKPTLILHGDILELALAEDNVAAMVFGNFLKQVFEPGRELFDGDVYFVPGNHDHHLWESAREDLYRSYVEPVPDNAILNPPWHATRMFENESLSKTPESELINAVVERTGLGDVRVRVVYPNLAIASGDRVVVIHHGHFTEAMYRLMSSLKVILFPGQPLGQEVWDWESDNFAWIDFFWSTLGRSGQAGADVGFAYDMLRDKKAFHQLVRNMTTFLVSRLHPLAIRVLARVPAFVLAYLIVRLAARRERAQPKRLSNASRSGLDKYLSGPVKRQLVQEQPGFSDRDVAFIFGHTHKPFEETLNVDGFAKRLRVYNSGGWVVDTTKTANQQGGAVILIDDECNVTSLRMYNQTNAATSQVRLEAADSAGDCSFRDRLKTALDFDSAPWNNFSVAARAAVEDRHNKLGVIIEHGIALSKRRMKG